MSYLPEQPTRKLPRSSSQSGLTLLEVILAISILAIMMSLNYRILVGIVEAKTAIDDKREGMFIANSVLTRISRELQLATIDGGLLPGCDSAGALSTQPPGGSGAGAAVRQVFKGEQGSAGGAQGGGATLTFLAKEGGQYIPDGGTHSGVVQITYRVEPDPDQKGEKNPTLLLVRDEVPYGKNVQRACANAIHFPITKNLVSLEFQYFDKKTEEWSAEWSEGKTVSPPAIVQFKIDLRTPEGNLESYTSAVSIRSEKQTP